jgi:AraC family transcriptional regulator
MVNSAVALMSEVDGSTGDVVHARRTTPTPVAPRARWPERSMMPSATSTPREGLVAQPGHNSDFIVCYQRDNSGQICDVWIGEHSTPASSRRSQRVQILNLDDAEKSEEIFGIQLVRFYLKPVGSDIVRLGDEEELDRSSDGFNGAIYDPIVCSLVFVLLSALDVSDHVNARISGSVAWILHVHFSRTYGKLKNKRHRSSILAPWQERRAKELIVRDLSQNISIKHLAKECELSPSYFCRAFSQSTGLPPHRWLLEKRIERVRELLTASRMPLAEVAIACGFFDQSHLTKVFSRAIGMTPGAWQRLQRQ